MADGQSRPDAAQASPSSPAPVEGTSARVETSPPRVQGPRDRLAHAALDAALRVEGVAGLAAPTPGLSSLGPLFAGVDVVAQDRDRYGLTLHLAARLVPLLPLADAVRDAVASAARRDGLADDLGRVDVRFEALEAQR
ncbi:MAG: hypothetical protein MSC31_05335 [Solirubrobacteraceae bacterium MAG38_C4-C5]|nr:hypothetical protein [Candidatus Siliceabacter maunaloa]